METLYLNHAGTSWPKPSPVFETAERAAKEPPASWPASFDSLHEKVCHFFNVKDKKRLLLAPSATGALSFAIHHFPFAGSDLVLTSSFEHQAVMGPLATLFAKDVLVERLSFTKEKALDTKDLVTYLQKGKTKLVVMTAACNVTGEILPYKEVISLCQKYGVRVLLDASQVAGYLDLDFPLLGADYIVFTGHKGLLAPTGIAGLYVKEGAPLLMGGASCDTGEAQGCLVPSYCDIGSVNRLALSGLGASVGFLARESLDKRLLGLREKSDALFERLSKIKSLSVLRYKKQNNLPTLCMVLKSGDTKKVADFLTSQNCHVAAGFQCSPQSYASLGAFKQGGLRVSFGYGNSMESVSRFYDLLLKALKM